MIIIKVTIIIITFDFTRYIKTSNMPQKNYFARKILVAGDEAEAIRMFARKEISIFLNECFFTIETIYFDRFAKRIKMIIETLANKVNKIIG